jgi:hypothetical protein
MGHAGEMHHLSFTPTFFGISLLLATYTQPNMAASSDDHTIITSAGVRDDSQTWNTSYKILRNYYEIVSQLWYDEINLEISRMSESPEGPAPINGGQRPLE